MAEIESEAHRAQLQKLLSQTVELISEYNTRCQGTPAFGTLLWQYRTQAKKKSAKLLAELSGMTTTTWTDYEKGKRSVPPEKIDQIIETVVTYSNQDKSNEIRDRLKEAWNCAEMLRTVQEILEKLEALDVIK